MWCLVVVCGWVCVSVDELLVSCWFDSWWFLCWNAFRGDWLCCGLGVIGFPVASGVTFEFLVVVFGVFKLWPGWLIRLCLVCLL